MGSEIEFASSIVCYLNPIMALALTIGIGVGVGYGRQQGYTVGYTEGYTLGVQQTPVSASASHRPLSPTQPER
jgi:hypothetical protein